MPRYRIVQKSKWFYVEKRGLFGWRPYIKEVGSGDPYPFFTLASALSELDRNTEPDFSVVVWDSQAKALITTP